MNGSVGKLISEPNADTTQQLINPASIINTRDRRRVLKNTHTSVSEAPLMISLSRLITFTSETPACLRQRCVIKCNHGNVTSE